MGIWWIVCTGGGVPVHSGLLGNAVLFSYVPQKDLALQ
jgi:hypothetical protein